jgi:NAD(P)-dependent dehydrogenase (short-subunit alcohol dehydrogenase family)
VTAALIEESGAFARSFVTGEIESALGALDVLVNNAGRSVVSGPFVESDPARSGGASWIPTYMARFFVREPGCRA